REAQQETEGRRKELVRWEVRVEQEQGGRLQAEAARDEALRRLAEAERELEALRTAGTAMIAAVEPRQVNDTPASAPVARVVAPPKIATVAEVVPARVEAVEPVVTESIASPVAEPVVVGQAVTGSVAVATPDEADVTPEVPVETALAPSEEVRTQQPATAAEPEVEEDEDDTEEVGKDKRRARRVAAHIPAVLKNERLSQNIACMICDRSSTGAKLEFSGDRFTDGASRLSIGDSLVLTFSMGPERTSVACEVVWISGSHCGVRLSGQFRTEIITRKKSSRVKEIAQALQDAESRKRKMSVGRLAKSILSR
ncbi:MAG: PilZ domain-containing protein, partial [Hyphomicrobiaceae bacterium]